MGLSIRAYARHRGVSHVAVKKAIDSGRITQLPDGTIDPIAADVQWAQNTLSPRQAKALDAKPAHQDTVAATQPVHAAIEARHTSQSRSTPDPVVPALSAGTTSLLQARTVNEVIKAQRNKVKLAAEKNELVDRAQAVAHVFKLARSERDAWLNWPARICAELASDFGADAHAMHVALDAAVREHLQELGDLNPKVN